MAGSLGWGPGEKGMAYRLIQPPVASVLLSSAGDHLLLEVLGRAGQPGSRLLVMQRVPMQSSGLGSYLRPSSVVASGARAWCTSTGRGTWGRISRNSVSSFRDSGHMTAATACKFPGFR